MAPRSPTHAFEPTPALERNPTNYSPFNRKASMLSFDSYHPGLPKEDRLTEQSTAAMPRAHSIATENVPLLPAIASASAIPKAAFRITNPTPGIDITAYIENCRNLNEQLRHAHDAERKAWNIERTALKSKIADLEFKLNKVTNNKTRSSRDGQLYTTYQPPKSDIRTLYQSNNPGALHSVSDSVVPTVAPVWKGPEPTLPTTRVFQTDETNGHHLSSISEDEATLPSLTKEISPGTVIESEPIPVEQVDSTLDGITLRSTGLTSSFVKITSPQFGSPMQSPTASAANEKVNGKALHIDASTLLSPLDEKLKRFAGHTPLAVPDDVSIGTSAQETEISTPIAEHPPAPAPTTRPPLRPSEQSDSYFSTASNADIEEITKDGNKQRNNGQREVEHEAQVEPEDDKPLTGPLMLDPSAKSKAASSFLDQLDAKLEAVREESPDRRQSFATIGSVGDEQPEVSSQPSTKADQGENGVLDDMPKLKLKKSTNFGSAYGWNMPGKV